MAKISELVTLEGTSIDIGADLLVIADASAGQTKKTTPADLRKSFGGPINVKDFGAGTGGWDTAKIQAALDAVPDNVGGVVLVPCGSYFIDATLRIKPKTRLLGESRFSASQFNFYLASPSIVGLKASLAAAGPDGHIEIENIHFQNSLTVAGHSAIDFFPGAPHSRITNCTFNNWTKYGIQVNTSWDLVFSHCYFQGIIGVSGSGDIGTAIFGNTNCNAWEIHENAFLSCDRAIQIESGTDIQITGTNNCELTGYLVNGTPNPAFAIYSAIVIGSSQAVTISGNYFEATRGFGIVVAGVKGLTVEGNYVNGEEPGNVVVMKSFLQGDACEGIRVGGNRIISYLDPHWIVLSATGVSTNGAVTGMFTNVVMDGGVPVIFPAGASGVRTLDSGTMNESGAISIAALGSNQNVSVDASGAGNILLNGSGITGQGIAVGHNNPSYPFHVVGPTGTLAAFRAAGASLTQTLFGNGSGDMVLRVLDTGDAIIFSDTGKYLALGTNGGEKMRISSAGEITVALGNVEFSTTGKGVILKSPDGTRYRIQIANGGALSTTPA